MNFELVPLILIVLGLIISFFGFKIQKAAIIIAWFLLGFTLSEVILVNFITDETVLFILQVVIGFILGIFGIKLEKLALLIAVTYMTFVSIGGFIELEDQNLALLIQGVIALFAGGLSVLMIKPIIIGITGIFGASLINSNLGIIIPSLTSNIILIISIVIAVLSILYQIKSNN